MYREQIDHYIDTHKEEMIEDLKTLVRIDSQRTAAKEGMPSVSYTHLRIEEAETN